MRVARAETLVPLAPAAAERLWTDVGRWPTFVEGFKHVLEIDPGWPQVGSKLVWTSGPAGRGRVTERVRESGEGRFATQVFEDRLTGTQTALFEPHEEGSMVAVELEYELQKGGRLRAIADALFIRRALRDALRRTLRRFATEAEAETAM